MGQFYQYMSDAVCNFLHLAANAATQVKTGEGVLKSITINIKGASANRITVYDGTDTNGTVIAIIDSTEAAKTLEFCARFATGLHIVIATGTAPDITVSYV